MLKLIARGMSNAEIAGRLFVSQATVKTHVTRILPSSTSAIACRQWWLAYECGLAQPGVE